MPLGYMLANMCEKINIKSKKISITLLVTCIEIVVFLYQFYVLKHEVTVLFDYSYIIVSALCVMLLYNKAGYLSRLLEKIAKNKYVHRIAMLSTSVYFVHMIFVDEYIYKTGGFVEKSHMLIILLAVFAGACVLSGINKIIQTKIKSYINSDLVTISEK